MLLIDNSIRSSRRMVTNLLAKQLGLARVAVVGPVAEKQLPEERVQRLLLAAQLFTAGTVLLTESAEEPLHDQNGALLGTGFLGRGDEEIWVFGPVGGIFDQTCGGEDERRGCQGPEVSVERGDCLYI